MNFKNHILLAVIALLAATALATTTVSSFEGLAQTHCQEFPIELLYRLSTGRLAQVYGKDFADIDCYVRQFVNKDGQDTFDEDQYQDEEEDEQEGNEAEPIQDIPDIDPLVEQYAPGLKSCLPEGTDAVEAVYAIWRFYRFVLQHDYTLEWMRAKIRASLGYEAEKPNAWMDGQQSAPRLRLDKLFSNQFYDYVDQLMFRDFLHPVMTFLKKNVVFAATGSITESGKPILIQYIENKNLMDKIFLPVVFQHRQAGNMFAYTLPGIPLLLAGTNSKISWAFTGVLIDRSNIEQIQTLGSKFYHQGSETWIKLENVTYEVQVKDSEPSQCKFVHSSYGTLYEKHKSPDGGKVAEYIARWHEKQKKVRVVFSQLMDLIINEGVTNSRMEFPFSSLVLTNSTGVFQYLCFQKHPSYFLYPDLTGAPDPNQERWVSNFKRNFLIVTNTHLTTKNQENYLKKQIMNPTEQQYLIETRRKVATTKDKFTLEKLFDFINNVHTDPLVKKRRDTLIYIYRKAKFLFFPEQNLRKQCDQIVALLEKWNGNLKNPTITPAFILWDYFFRDYTFNYVSTRPIGAHIAKHRVLTDVYWTNQAENWKAGTSYGECDSDQWNLVYRDKLYGAGDNSSCFLNVMRGINRTREILRSQDGSPIKEPKLSDFIDHKIKNIKEGYIGTPIEEAFNQFYSKGLAFATEIDNPKVIYFEGYQEEQKEVNLKDVVQSDQQAVEDVKEPEERQQLDSDL